MPGEGLGGDVRQVLLLLLTASRGASDPLPQPHQRVDNEGSTRHAHQRQSGIVVEEQPGVGNQGDCLAQEITDGLRDDLLNPVDVVGGPRHQTAGRPLREKASRLPQDVSEQLTAEVLDEPLSDIGH